MEIDGWSIRYSRVSIVNRLCKMIVFSHYASHCATRYKPPATILDPSFQPLDGKYTCIFCGSAVAVVTVVISAMYLEARTCQAAKPVPRAKPLRVSGC